MKRKKLLLIFIVLFVGVMLMMTGCGGGNSSNNNTNNSSGSTSTSTSGNNSSISNNNSTNTSSNSTQTGSGGLSSSTPSISTESSKIANITGEWIIGSYIDLSGNIYTPDDYAASMGIDSSAVTAGYTFKKDGSAVMASIAGEFTGSYTFDGTNLLLTMNGQNLNFEYGVVVGNEALVYQDPNTRISTVLVRFTGVQAESGEPSSPTQTGNNEVTVIAGEWIIGSYIDLSGNSYTPDDYAASIGIDSSAVTAGYTFNKDGSAVMASIAGEFTGSYTFDGINLLLTMNGQNLNFEYGVVDGNEALVYQDPNTRISMVLVRFS